MRPETLPTGTLDPPQITPLPTHISVSHASTHSTRTAHLRPGSYPPLGWAGYTEAWLLGLWPVTWASLGWHGLLGTVGERQQALHRPGLQPQFPTAPAAGTPLFCHPPGDRQDRGGRRWEHGDAAPCRCREACALNAAAWLAGLLEVTSLSCCFLG